MSSGLDVGVAVGNATDVAVGVASPICVGVGVGGEVEPWQPRATKGNANNQGSTVFHSPRTILSVILPRPGSSLITKVRGSRPRRGRQTFDLH